MLPIVALLDLELEHLVMIIVFLHGSLEEKIYMD